MNFIKVKLSAKMLALILFIFLSFDAACQNNDLNIWRNIIYHVENGIELKLNLFIPKISQDNNQLVILLHGERMQNKEDFECLAINLAKLGTNVATIDYRIPPDYSYPKAINDVLTAIEWIRKNSQSYSLSFTTIGLAGQNFGGYIATLTGIKYPDTIHGIAAIHAPMNLTNYNPPPSGYSYRYQAFVGFPLAQNPERWQEVSPFYQVNEKSPPILLLHGVSDEYVPFSQSEEMEKEINSQNGLVWLYSSEKAGNGSFIKSEMCENTAKILARFYNFSLSSLSKVEIEKNLIYANINERNLHMDIIKPQNVDGKLPVVIFIHGGGWVWGNKKDMWEEAAELASKGFITATVEYRLARERIYPAAVDDLKAAVRWLRSNANKYDIQSNKIGVVGRSAGGHLASLLGVTSEKKYFGELIGPSDPSAEIQSVVTMSGVVDMTGLYPRDPFAPSVFLGYSLIEAPELYQKASPVNHVGNKSAPFLFIHGTKDHLGSHDEVINMANKLQSFGITGEVHSIENGGHDFEKNPKWRVEAMNAMVDFFEKTLKNEIQK